jgi:predicted DNA-binding transcriptional regulator AlpA
MQSTALPQTGFLRLSQVLKFIPICRVSWYAGIKTGKYPAPIKIGPRTAAYRAEDIAALIAKLGSGASSNDN